MNTKRVMAAILSLIMISSLTSCKENEGDSVVQESSTVSNNVVGETVTQNILNTESAVLNTTSVSTAQTTTQTSSTEKTSTSTESTTKNTPAETRKEVSESSDNPAEWSKERIIDEYKKAAKKTNGNAKSKQNITLQSISINNGEYDSAISMVKPIIAKFIESKSTEIDGITGGFENLTAQDVKTAKAYQTNDGTVIEMTMVEQTSGAKEDALSGSVGHAIATVGDISTVTGDLADIGLPLEISEKDTKIYYTNPVVKVTIDGNGEIVSGSWSYIVEICMNNFKAFGKTVDKASITMENTIIL
ncbi:MAG: hypothetical protein J6D06_04705 [Clostridia bacterium]|nr:hypothetical protein [Clostridia bacterium]